MNHAVVTEHLADYLEGDLALDLRALVDAHLDGCTACAQEVREMQQTIRLLRALPEPEPPPMIAANVMRRIRAGETQPSLLERVQRAVGGVLEPSFVLPASAMAIAALVIFVIQGRGPMSESVVPSGGTFAANAPSDEGRVDDEASNRSFGASAARELAAAPAPSRRIEPRATAPVQEAGGLPFAASAREADRAEASYPARSSARSPARNAASEAIAVERWDAGESLTARVAPARPSASGSFFGDSALVQGFAPSGSTPKAASNRISGSPATAMPTSLSRRTPGGEASLRGEDSGGEDPRDAWLARALENPVEFAHYISRHNLAEQELWVARLAERARSRGLLDDVVDSLRAAGDEKTAWLADDFAAAGQPVESSADDGARDLDDRGPVGR